MKSLSKENTVAMSPSVLKAINSFKPVFGLNEDIRIGKKYNEIVDMLKTIDSSRMRQLITDKKLAQLTPKMKEIRQKEKELIAIINERNTL